MSIDEIVSTLVNKTYKTACLLTNQTMKVNYACIFSQSNAEFSDLIDKIKLSGGTVVDDTEMGPVFKIDTVATEAGNLRILKIRKPDPRRKERGDAGFTLDDYIDFKKANLNKSGFKLIQREKFEMLEFDPQDGSNLVYFSNPPLAETLGLGHLL
jgi:hypothetical protein